MIAQNDAKNKTPLEWAVYYYETDTAMTTRMESARFYLELAKVEQLKRLADSLNSIDCFMSDIEGRLGNIENAISYYVDMETADE